MKYLERVFFLIVVCVVLIACEEPGVPSQSTSPIANQAITDIPSSIPEQITFPQMTGTALAVPTVIYPTEKPLTPEELFQLSQLKTTSPDGNYVITCDYSFPTVFHVPTKTVISTTNIYFGCGNEDSSWSPDSSYIFLVEGNTKDIYRWRMDGSQPEFLEINKLVEPKKLNYPDWSVRMRWSPDGKYLAIHKFDLYVVTPDDEESFKNPLLIEECSGCFEDFRWATSNLLMYDYFRSYTFVQIPSGKGIGWLGRSGGICTAQIPLISPDEHWMTFDAPWCGGGEPGPNQYTLANLKDGSVQVFSQSFADRIDFIGWEKDSSEFYLISRPAELNAQADQRTPFGLLALNPQTLQTRNLFEQAWYVAFNEDMSWAYIIFPSKNDNGSLRLDGGLWQVVTAGLVGRQVMAHSLEETFLNPYSSPDTAYMYSPSGQELGFSADTTLRPLPAAWSHDNSRVATVNPEHQLVVITLDGDIQVVGKLDNVYLWINTIITWSDDDKFLDVDGVKWTVP